MRVVMLFVLVLLISEGQTLQVPEQNNLKTTDSSFSQGPTFPSLLEAPEVPIEVPYQDIDE